MKRILAFLAKGQWVRSASPKAVISFFSQLWNSSIKYKRTKVLVHLDVEANQWVVSLDQATELQRFPNNFITNKRIMKLDLRELD